MRRNLLPHPRLDQDSQIQDRHIRAVHIDSIFMALLFAYSRTSRFERLRQVGQELYEHLGGEIELFEDRCAG